MAFAANGALWSELHRLSLLGSASGWALALGLGLATALALVLLASLLAWRWTLKPVLTFLLLAAAFGAYFMQSYRVVIDATMLVNVFQTDTREAAALFSLRLLAVVGVLGVLPVVLLWRTPVAYGPWPRRLLRNLLASAAAVLALAAVAVAIFQPLSSTMRNHKQVRYLVNPLNSVYALGYLAATPLRRDMSITEPIGLDARIAAPATAASVRPPLLVLVVGETARAPNFSLNGYARATNPELARENVASFRNAWSCGTSTAASLPCMFSHLGREAFNGRPHNYEGLLDVVQRAGMAVLWLDNQSGCKGNCDRVPHVEASQFSDPALCKGGECFDAVMLKDIDQRIAALPAERRARGVLLVMHQMGSHGPAYWLRSPPQFKRFAPECQSNNLQDCARESLVNAYDNSIVYTDHFLASTIGWLKTRAADYDAALLYVSDHGESLGENNLYLHGLPYAIAPDVQKHVPWITWLSAGFEQRSGVATACLQKAADAPVSHDHYFHSVLGLLDVQTSVYQRALDAYAACRSTPAPARMQAPRTP
jgi:lipid A ethanolaminephosphotransferase